ncbi:nucleolar protein 10 [Toxorhynchites rutilus septentrionalis]|uniref:nucleolar protein 10 n=1 Tax=Toxorhynchites rutilus septentrionalis TaxID=329112 RepID=UPI00247B0853|nr:nucleolar protein 10 [Toxorhynchites rutilus septentrionalis]
MLVTDVGEVKIYNLSAGKALPDWVSDKKRREAQRKNVDINRRIELIQDFEMPTVATSVDISPDGQYILATGTYKPRVKCYEVNNLSLKFERCFDSEVVKFKILSDDYGKIAFLQADRYVEFHAAHGRHYRLRIPRFGRDLDYHKPSCDLFLVGTSSEIYRLNTERGQFLQSYETSASSINTCEVNPEHYLLCVGSQEGTVEAWDPRTKSRCGVLDVAASIKNNDKFPSVSSLKFKNGLQMGVGTTSGHVLLYDIRAKEPLLIKDHLNELPVKKLDFNKEHNAVYSLDAAMLKIWDESTGKQLAYIESNSNFNDFTTSPRSGLFFLAQEDAKMLTYYIPNLGPAPRWCSFLDNLTEEIESEYVQNIYDDYKFITKHELAELGLSHLEGTNMLRAYMHGFFIDIRLYNKAKTIADPFAFERYRKEKIAKQIQETRPARLQLKSKLPKVNAELVEKLLTEQDAGSSKLKAAARSLLKDDRFKGMFENPDFAVDKTAQEYRLLNPVLTRLDKTKAKKLKAQQEAAEAAAVKQKEGEEEGSTDDDLFSEKEDSSDDEQVWTKEVKREYNQIQRETKRALLEEDDEDEGDVEYDGSSVQVQEKEDFNISQNNRKISKAGLGKRLAASKPVQVKTIGGLGNCQMTFSTERKKNNYDRKRQMELKKHREERKRVIRPTTSLGLRKAHKK